MFRLLRLTLALIATFAAGIFVASRISSTQPSALAVLFTNPDGTPCERPCLFGVRPGTTTRNEAIALLKAHPATRNFQPETLLVYGLIVAKPDTTLLNGMKIVIQLYTDREERERVSQIGFYLIDSSSQFNRQENPQRLPITAFGDFISTFGKFDELVGYEEGDGTPVTVFVFPDQNLGVNVRTNGTNDLFSGNVITIGIHKPESTAQP